MNFSNKVGEPLQVIFLDVTDEGDDPILLKNVSFAFTPVFNIGAKITFQKGKASEPVPLDSQGDKHTHKVKSVQWSFTDIDFQDGESQLLPIMTVNLVQIDEMAELVSRPSATVHTGLS